MRNLLCVWLLLMAAWPATAAPRPNIIIVLVDDVGYGDFACHGHPFIKTPAIDRLHGESIRLTDFHVTPMCSPTRGQFLTGCHGLRTGVTSVTAGRTFLRPEFPTMPQMFGAVGYRTGLFGKWHLGDSYPHRPIDKGFQDAVWVRGWGFTSAPEFENTLIDGSWLRGSQPEKFQGYITDACFSEAMRWMQERQKAGEPFFCFLPLHAAHAPHVVPPRYAAPYRDSPAADFFGMIANIDENMARLDDFLRGTRLRENTLVLFFTDNGGTAGVNTYNAGLRGGKVTYWDGGHRVPCFIRWPAGRLRPAGDITQLTQVQDLFPTLLDLCQVPRLPGPAFDGVSLAPLLQGSAEKLPARTLFVQFGPGFGQKEATGPQKFASAIMRDQWRLVHGTNLYDLATDRAQERDLSASRPEIVKSLRADYDTWWAGVSPRLQEFVPLHIGATQENPVTLTSADWQDRYVDNARHIRNAMGGPRGGEWTIRVERAGQYQVTVSRWPFIAGASLNGNVSPPGKALPVASAKLSAGGREYTVKVTAGAKTAGFNLPLPAGPLQLQAWFQDAEGQDLAGAFYARVERLPQ